MLSAFVCVLQTNEQATEDGTWSWKQGLDGRLFALALSGDGGDGAAPKGVAGASAPSRAQPGPGQAARA